jgi:hypothetical protein
MSRRAERVSLFRRLIRRFPQLAEGLDHESPDVGRIFTRRVLKHARENHLPLDLESLAAEQDSTSPSQQA